MIYIWLLNCRFLILCAKLTHFCWFVSNLKKILSMHNSRKNINNILKSGRGRVPLSIFCVYLGINSVFKSISIFKRMIKKKIFTIKMLMIYFFVFMNIFKVLILNACIRDIHLHQSFADRLTYHSKDLSLMQT